MNGVPVPRLDRAWFDRAEFPMTTVIATRFGDVDRQGHINNVAIVGLLQEARIAFGRALGGPPPDGLQTVVAGTMVDYAGEMHFPEPVEVGIGIVHIGRTSFTFAQRIRQSGVAAVYARVTVVLTGNGKSREIPAEFRARLEGMLLDPAA